ncbi:MAG: DeoR family transcriptional regulator, partial [Spirochaetales bacterium]
MRINERKDEIIRILSNADYVTVDEFSRQLGVSKVTI